MQDNNNALNVIGLDVGDARIGVARANVVAKIPEPLAVINNDIEAPRHITEIINEQSASTVIIGLPLLASGDDSQQTKKVRDFAKKLSECCNAHQIFVDESHSSQEADLWLNQHKRSDNSYNDDIAACIILERYLS